jgi:hypothetical protein
VIYLDVDCIITLAELNLLQFFERTYDVELEIDVSILRTSIYQASKVTGERAKSEYADFCGRCLPVSDHLLGETYEQILNSTLQVHEEAKLFAACIEDEYSVGVLTGDYNAVRDFAKNAPPDLANKLVGKIKLIEHVICDVLEEIDQEEFLEALRDSSYSKTPFDQVLYAKDISEIIFLMEEKMKSRADIVKPFLAYC